jgi:3-hydroxyisobutyrate dehydrogenase-like beta-hydroxyacid dehydrogenase
MGLPMARNLLRAGHHLHVYNRTAAKAQPVIDAGAWPAASPQGAAAAGIVFSMLANDAVLEAVTLGENGILGRLGEGGIHVSMSTVAPETARNLAEQHDTHGEHYISAPVFGRPEVAAAGNLAICLAGAAAAKGALQPLLNALGNKIVDFGGHPGSANVVKLAGNFMIGAAMEAMAEAFALGEKNGVVREKMAELYGQTLFSCPVYQGYGAVIAQHRYEPAGFQLALGHKDLSLALRVAADSTMPMPLANLVHERLTASLAKGRQSIEWAGLALEATEDAGLGIN